MRSDKSIRERLDDPEDEVHEIHPEDLEAAADFYDNLIAEE